MGLELLLGETLESILSITVIECNGKFLQDDTIILKTQSGTFFQMLINHVLSIREISHFNEIEIIGEYDDYRISSGDILKLEQEVEVRNIYNYRQNTYHFASKFTDRNNNFLFGICFGFDELKLIDINEFDEMLTIYNNYTLEHLR